jgi:hypothetical protein
MKSARFVCPFILFAIATALSQNPVPLVNQPLVPTAIAPGGASFKLTVNGTGFVSGSKVNWNGTPLTTTFVSNSQLTAAVRALNIVKASSASITVSSPSPGGGTSNVTFFAVSAPTTLQFTTFPSNSSLTAWAQPIVADFNRDGKLDFVMLSNVNPGGYPDPHAFVFLGNDDGSFQPPQQTQDGFLTFATGDFNGDGILDLAGFNGCSPAACTFGILLGNGDGTFSRYFSAFEILPANQNVMQVVTGDFKRRWKA